MKVNYWVMQVIGGHTIAHGPYRTKDGRDNRMRNIHGGEISPFKTYTEDAEEAIQEFSLKELDNVLDR